MRQPLTKRQREIYDFIATSIEANGYAPSLGEIGAAMGLRSMATIHKHVECIRTKGWITRRRNGRRSMDIAAPEGCCPVCRRPMADDGDLAAKAS